MNEIQLKPCPFCGKIPTIRQYKVNHSDDGVFSASYELKCEKCKIGDLFAILSLH